MGSSNPESIRQQNDCMANECCGLAEKHVDANKRAQSLKLIEYYSEKENYILWCLWLLAILTRIVPGV